jgi:hypothetical protein
MGEKMEWVREHQGTLAVQCCHVTSSRLYLSLDR